jgi:hypothetical protein
MGFCLIAAILYCTRYITVALFHIGFNEFAPDNFKVLLDGIGTPLLTLSIISLIIGLIYLALGFKKE